MSDSTATIAALKRLLGTSYTLYLKTHNFHWNVTGPMFTTLHTLFETQYTELALAVDEIAERIRTLGDFAPGTYREFVELSAIDETDGRPKAEDMIRILVDDGATLSAVAADVIAAAEAAGDVATADLATRRIDITQKNAWMLRAHLE